MINNIKDLYLTKTERTVLIAVARSHNETYPAEELPWSYRRCLEVLQTNGLIKMTQASLWYDHPSGNYSPMKMIMECAKLTQLGRAYLKRY